MGWEQMVMVLEQRYSKDSRGLKGQISSGKQWSDEDSRSPVCCPAKGPPTALLPLQLYFFVAMEECSPNICRASDVLRQARDLNFNIKPLICKCQEKTQK